MNISKENLSHFIYSGSLYFITVGALFLWGYWTPFDINILEYIGLTDILKITAYPIAVTMIFTLAGAAIGELFTHGSNPKIGRPTAAVARFLKEHPKMLLMTYISLIFTAILIGHQLLALILALPVYALLKRINFLSEEIPHENTRSIIIFVLSIIPFFSYGTGNAIAKNIIDGKSFTYVLSDLPHYKSRNTTQEKFRFIGHAGSHIFLYDPKNKSTIITQLSKDTPLEIKPFQRNSDGNVQK